MRFIPLASSSAGNAYLIEDGSDRLLLECGLTYKRLTRLAGERLGGLCGCLITHEHGDHAKCWRELIKSGARVHASARTIEALAEQDPEAAALVETLPEAGERARQSAPRSSGGDDGRDNPFLPFRAGPFDVLPFPTCHDAAQPVGYLIRSGGEKLAFATDTAVIHSRFPGVNILALEANYDAAILARCERMPDKVKHRVRNNHMEIGELCRYLQGADLSRCREIWLLHLSSASASEGDFVRRVREAVPRQASVYAAPALCETGGQK